MSPRVREMEARLARMRRTSDRLRSRLWFMRRSRDMWRTRARAAEWALKQREAPKQHVCTEACVGLMDFPHRAAERAIQSAYTELRRGYPSKAEEILWAAARSQGDTDAGSQQTGGTE